MNRCFKKFELAFVTLMILLTQVNLISFAAIEETTKSNLNEQQSITYENDLDGNTVLINPIPRAFVVNVSNFAQFRDAIRDPSVEQINVLNDISDAPAGYEILVPGHNVTINGNNNTIDLKTSWIRLQNITNSTEYKFTINNAKVVNSVALAFVQTYFSDYRSEYWSLYFNNIKTNPNMERLAVASRSNLTFGGSNIIITRAENVYTGGMTFLPNSTYDGEINFYDYSIIWFQDGVSSTGLTSHRFNVGEGATVKLRGTTNGATYPAIFQYYDSINIASGAVLDVEKRGVTVAFHQDNSTLNIERNATFRASSLSTGTNIIGIDARRSTAKNISIHAEEGSCFYVTGNSTSPLVNLPTTGSKLRLIKPAKFDIRNNNNLASINGNTVQVGSDATFEILDSDIEVWTKGLDLDGSPAYSWYKASLITGSSGLPLSASEPSIMSNYKGKTITRISATNSNPITYLNELTNADKKLTGHVTIDGSPASFGQVNVTVSNNQDDQTWNVTTDQNGNFTVNLGDFYNENTIFTAIGLRGPYPSNSTQTTVKDVTPPSPASINEPVSIISQKITGKSDEAGAKVTATVNGVELDINEAVYVSQDGDWEIPISTPLNAGDIIQVFLSDRNNNKNPNTDEIFHDAIFYGATKTNVTNEIPPTADPINMILNIGDEFPLSPNSYLKNIYDSSGETLESGLTATFVLETIPSTNQVGRYTVDVILKNSSLLFSKIKIPVFITDEFMETNENFALSASDFIVNSQELSDLSPNEINEFILFKSKAEGINITTGENLSNQIIVLSTNIDKTIGGHYVAALKLESLTKIINITVINPILKFNKIPSIVQFETTPISNVETAIRKDETYWDMSVLDYRGIGRKWTITASIDKPLTSTSDPANQLVNALVFIDHEGNSTPLNSNELIVFEQTTGVNPLTHVNWPNNQGIVIKTNFADVYNETYSTIINWTLTDAP